MKQPVIDPFPRIVLTPKTPPIKTQGIKTKLIPFIFRSVKWDGTGRWIEPFLGSGVVLFNAAPERALVGDANKVIISVYKAIQSGQMTPESIRVYLEHEGSILREKGAEYYYEVRKRFNVTQSPEDFLFLNRACFNGIVRFNSKGGFNVPFCAKPNRFDKSYVTKICNQVAWVRDAMHGKAWAFHVQDWRETLSGAKSNDFVYLDPPYVGRHTDYYNQWSQTDADDLADMVKQLPCGFAYSMWKENTYRKNEHLIAHFKDFPTVTHEHFYHVGATEELRNSMEEALVVSPANVAETIIAVPGLSIGKQLELTELD